MYDETYTTTDAEAALFCALAEQYPNGERFDEARIAHRGNHQLHGLLRELGVEVVMHSCRERRATEVRIAGWLKAAADRDRDGWHLVREADGWCFMQRVSALQPAGRAI
jgi:hypothetical protein